LFSGVHKSRVTQKKNLKYNQTSPFKVKTQAKSPDVVWSQKSKEAVLAIDRPVELEPNITIKSEKRQADRLTLSGHQNKRGSRIA